MKFIFVVIHHARVNGRVNASQRTFLNRKKFRFTCKSPSSSLPPEWMEFLCPPLLQLPVHRYFSPLVAKYQDYSAENISFQKKKMSLFWFTGNRVYWTLATVANSSWAPGKRDSELLPKIRCATWQQWWERKQLEAIPLHFNVSIAGSSAAVSFACRSFDWLTHFSHYI